MPRGDNPNSRANLIPVTERTKEEAREISRKGGKKSGVTRAAQANLKKVVKEQGTPDRLSKISNRLYQMAEAGNLNAIKLLLELRGEDPKSEFNRELLRLRKREVELKEEGW